MKKSLWIAGGIGAALALAILVLLLNQRPPDSMASMEVRAARSWGVKTEDFRKVNSLTDRIRAEKGTVKKEDWEVLVQNAQGSNVNMRQSSLVAISQLSPDSPHKIEAVSLAKKYLEEDHAEGNVGPILVLKRFDDPSWKTHAQALSANNNPNYAEIGRRLLDPVER